MNIRCDPFSVSGVVESVVHLHISSNLLRVTPNGLIARVAAMICSFVVSLGIISSHCSRSALMHDNQVVLNPV